MSYDGRVYQVEIGGLMRDLPLFEVAPKVKIAIFNMLGDTAIIERVADILAAQAPGEGEVIVTPEVKAVPLAHAVSLRTAVPYVVARKIRKPYMVNCLEAEVISITTGKPQTLYLDGKDRHLVEGKNAILLDDVISTGSTMRGLRLLMQHAEAPIVAEMAVFTEGNDADWSQVIALGHLPIFTD